MASAAARTRGHGTIRSRDRQAERRCRSAIQARVRREALASATSGVQPSTSRGPRASQRRTAISLCGWMCSTCTIRAAVRLDRGRQVVDRDVDAGPRVQDAARSTASESSASHDEPGAVVDVQQVARLGPVAVDRADGSPSSERRVKIATTPPSPTERWNGPYVLNGRTTVVGRPYAWWYESVSASPADLRRRVRRGGLRRVSLADALRRASPGRRPCTCS